MGTEKKMSLLSKQERGQKRGVSPGHPKRETFVPQSDPRATKAISVDSEPASEGMVPQLRTKREEISEGCKGIP